MNFDFRNWLITEKKDLFGFERARERQLPPPMGEHPITPTNGDGLMSELARYSLGVKSPKWEWTDRIQWGHGGTGSLQVQISPLGSFTATIRRKITDLEGDNAWLCKKVFPLRDQPNGINETVVAGNIFQHLAQIDKQMAEMPIRDFNEKQFANFVESLSRHARTHAPAIFKMEGIAKLNKYDYQIFFGVSGYGTEAPGSRHLEQFNINISYLPYKGLIRCWGNDISSPTGTHEWQLRPSEWDEYFSPAQPRMEAIEAICTFLEVY